MEVIMTRKNSGLKGFSQKRNTSRLQLHGFTKINRYLTASSKI